MPDVDEAILAAVSQTPDGWAMATVTQWAEREDVAVRPDELAGSRWVDLSELPEPVTRKMMRRWRSYPVPDHAYGARRLLTEHPATQRRVHPAGTAEDDIGQLESGFDVAAGRYSAMLLADLRDALPHRPPLWWRRPGVLVGIGAAMMGAGNGLLLASPPAVLVAAAMAIATVGAVVAITAAWISVRTPPLTVPDYLEIENATLSPRPREGSVEHGLASLATRLVAIIDGLGVTVVHPSPAAIAVTATDEAADISRRRAAGVDVEWRVHALTAHVAGLWELTMVAREGVRDGLRSLAEDLVAFDDDQRRRDGAHD